MTEKAIKDRLLCFPFSLSLSYMFVLPRHPHPPPPTAPSLSVTAVVDRHPGLASKEPWNLEPHPVQTLEA